MRAVDELIAFARSPDPFRKAPDNLAELQLEAARERFAERRQKIRVLDKRAREAGITTIDSFADLVPLLFAHTSCKSYPEAFVDNAQWSHMNMWLGTLSSYPTDNIDVADVRDIDDWLDRAKTAGHHVLRVERDIGQILLPRPVDTGSRSFDRRLSCGRQPVDTGLCA
ncbi:hypothetical protein [Sphingobium estronivorans]|uniref:hypothetical protein n=1 Tax=Sphingobium estronivorans TaxID=1577690 RepID=UPI001F071F6A|nr:hypothetical protein [Sphingobium estronivorans]